MNWFRDEYERTKRRNATVPPHSRPVVTSPVLSAHTRPTRDTVSDAGCEKDWETRNAEWRQMNHDAAGGAPKDVGTLLTHYLEARGMPMPSACDPSYVMGEAEELVTAWEECRPDTIRHELADVVLACAVVAHHLGTTVEACIATKTEYDQGRG